MEINIAGTNCDVGQALENHVKEHLTKITEKMHKHFAVIGTKVMFKKNKHHNYFTVEIIVNITGGMKRIVANGKDSDPYTAFKICKDVLQRIITKYKDKKSEHDHDSLKSIDAKYSIFDTDDEDDDGLVDEYAISEPDDPIKKDLPTIVAEYDQKIYHFSVENAVMHMEINGLPALLFINTLNNKINMVYHRHDGTIGWTAPNY